MILVSFDDFIPRNSLHIRTKEFCLVSLSFVAPIRAGTFARRYLRISARRSDTNNILGYERLNYPKKHAYRINLQILTFPVLGLAGIDRSGLKYVKLQEAYWDS